MLHLTAETENTGWYIESRQTHLWQKAKLSMLSVTKCAYSWGSSSFNRAASNSEEQKHNHVIRLYKRLYGQLLQ